jgi:hypothetical protein
LEVEGREVAEGATDGVLEVGAEEEVTLLQKTGLVPPLDSKVLE